VLLEQGLVVVAGDEVDDRLLGISGESMRMDVTLSVLGRLGREPVGRQRHHELRGKLDRVYELALRGARMHRQTPDRHPHGLRGERLDLELAETRAIQGVGDVCTERVEIEVLRATPNFFVDRECDSSERAGARGAGRDRRPRS
jgi:hypothetical protein